MQKNAQFPFVPRYKVISKIPKFVKNPIPILTTFHEEYGDTFYIYVGGLQKSLITRDPEVVREVLQRQHRNVEKSDLQTKMVAKYVGKGLLTNTGSDWLRQRRLIQPGFHRDKIENLMGLMMGVIEGFGKKIVDEQREEGQSIVPLNFSAAMKDLSFEIIARTLISQPVPEEDLNAMSTVVQEVQQFIVKQVRLPFLQPYFKWSGLERKHIEMVQEIRGRLMEYVTDRRKETGPTDDLLDMLLDVRYEDNGEPMSDEQLIDEMLILFVAGYETTANALSWTFYLLCEHPEYIDQIRAEAAAVFSSPLTLQSIKSLAVTGRVIEESMRIFPPAWITDRITLEDITLAGIAVPKKTLVIPFIYGVHHNPNHWPNPGQFNPDRFLPEQVKSRTAYSYLPFGGGPRFCIGNNFSMMEMQLAVAYLCNNFDFSMADKAPVNTKPMVTLRMDRDIEMFWQKRTKASI